MHNGSRQNKRFAHAESDQGAAACSAIGWAAFTSLRRLYPEDTEVLNVAIQNYRTLLRDTFPFQPLALFRGLVWGAQVSRAFRSERAGDNSLDPETAAFIVRCLASLLFLACKH